MNYIKKDLEEAIESLYKAISLSFKNRWNVHSSIGGKYGELFVANALWKHKPVIGKERKWKGCDINLAETEKRIEVKWGMLHYEPDDYYFKTRGKVPYWGWGFGKKGSQFLKNKFDYCIFLAAKKNEAHPKYIFVVKSEEMNGKTMEKRISGEAGKVGSYFLETSEDKDFFKRRRKKILIVERMLLRRQMHKKRWEELRENGVLQ